MNVLIRVLLTAITASVLTFIWLTVIHLENDTAENIGIGVIVFISVMLFSKWKK